MVRILHKREMFNWPFSSVLSLCWFDKSNRFGDLEYGILDILVCSQDVNTKLLMCLVCLFVFSAF